MLTGSTLEMRNHLSTEPSTWNLKRRIFKSEEFSEECEKEIFISLHQRGLLAPPFRRLTVAKKDNERILSHANVRRKFRWNLQTVLRYFADKLVKRILNI